MCSQSNSKKIPRFDNETPRTLLTANITPGQGENKVVKRFISGASEAGNTARNEVFEVIIDNDAQLGL